jgi:hypothetical protein
MHLRKLRFFAIHHIPTEDERSGAKALSRSLNVELRGGVRDTNSDRAV